MLYLAIFIAEFIWSLLANRANLNVVKRKPLKAAGYGFSSAIIAWAIPLCVFVYTQEWTYAIPAILGDTLGDYWAARRKSTKRPYRKKMPVSTA